MDDVFFARIARDAEIDFDVAREKVGTDAKLVPRAGEDECVGFAYAERSVRDAVRVSRRRRFTSGAPVFVAARLASGKSSRRARLGVPRARAAPARDAQQLREPREFRAERGASVVGNPPPAPRAPAFAAFAGAFI